MATNVWGIHTDLQLRRQGRHGTLCRAGTVYHNTMWVRSLLRVQKLFQIVVCVLLATTVTHFSEANIIMENTNLKYWISESTFLYYWVLQEWAEYQSCVLLNIIMLSYNIAENREPKFKSKMLQEFLWIYQRDQTCDTTNMLAVHLLHSFIDF